MPGKSASILPEYAGKGRAIIEPSRTKPEGVRLPSRAVLCFYVNVLAELAEQPDVTVIHRFKTQMGEQPILRLGKGRNAVAVVNPCIGAPMAVASLEQIVALGADRVIACGDTGVLDPDIAPGTVVIPTRALRDEGVSYHYQRRSRTNRPHPVAVDAVKRACRKHHTPFITGLTWTTDAFFRETPKIIAARQAEGCLTVEMEAAAFFAVASFRGIKFGQMLSAGDDVSGDEWDRRHWPGCPSAREKLLMLAIDAVRGLV